jgi:hypothetical protein
MTDTEKVEAIRELLREFTNYGDPVWARYGFTITQTTELGIEFWEKLLGIIDGGAS